MSELLIDTFNSFKDELNNKIQYIDNSFKEYLKNQQDYNSESRLTNLENKFELLNSKISELLSNVANPKEDKIEQINTDNLVGINESKENKVSTENDENNNNNRLDKESKENKENIEKMDEVISKLKSNIKTVSNELAITIQKYDKIIIDNLTIPGLLGGDKSKYQNLKALIKVF